MLSSETAAHCNTTTSHCDTLQLQHNNITLRHTATATQQHHTATHCNCAQQSAHSWSYESCIRVAVCCSVLQIVAVCCSVLQCVAACCSATALSSQLTSECTKRKHYKADVSSSTYICIHMTCMFEKFSRVSSLLSWKYTMTGSENFDLRHRHWAGRHSQRSAGSSIYCRHWLKNRHLKIQQASRETSVRIILIKILKSQLAHKLTVESEYRVDFFSVLKIELVARRLSRMSICDTISRLLWYSVLQCVVALCYSVLQCVV